jgi:pimeloyl-ACP methyl ester carboxylesterase
LYYESVDGWRAPLFFVPAAPGTAGEPVVLAHALGLSPDAFRVDPDGGIVTTLSRAGFSVYLLTHRGDAASLPPPDPRRFDFDDILERDLPAAMARVYEHAGYRRPHFVGHGLGGQLGLAYAARFGADGPATVTAIHAPVAFGAAAARSELRQASRIVSLLPSHWRIPTAAMAWATAPWVEGDHPRGSRVRGLLCRGMDDVSLGLAQQMARWIRSGSWTDRTGHIDYAESLVDARCPLLVVAPGRDRWCGSQDALLALERWGGGSRSRVLVEGYDHLDPLVSTERQPEWVDALVTFLSRHRARSVADAERVGGCRT